MTSRDIALRLLAVNYARLVDEADSKGSIEKGKLTDCVVPSADYVTIPAAQI